MTRNILSLVVAFLCLWSFPAYACLTATFLPPEDVKIAMQEGKEPNTKQLMRVEEFKRDKAFYESLVDDFCSWGLGEKHQAINQKLRDLLLEKWTLGEAE